MLLREEDFTGSEDECSGEVEAFVQLVKRVQNRVGLLDEIREKARLLLPLRFIVAQEALCRRMRQQAIRELRR